MARPQVYATNSGSVNSAISSSTVSSTASVPTINPNALEVQAEKYAAAYRTPISFFGKVTDQNGEAVPGADVTFYLKNRPLANSVSLKSVTDAQGLFSLTGTTGLSLGVEVAKAGYRVIAPGEADLPSSGSFQYGTNSHRFSPEREKPVIFRLFKLGLLEKLIITAPKDIIVPANGTALNISLDQQSEHRVILRCWNKWGEQALNERKYDWRVEIVVEQGGLLRRANLLAFEAPGTGYSAEEAIDIPASAPRWYSVVERFYFFQFQDGTFGRANLRMRAARNTFVVWQSFF